MPYTSEQWAAIAAEAIRKKGKKKGRAYLHKLKAEATKNGEPLIKK